jgi:hypothetical protein
MKNNFSKKFPVFFSTLFVLIVLAVTSAFAPSSTVPISPQTDARSQSNPALGLPSSLPISSLLSLPADTLTRIAFDAGTTSDKVTGNLASQAVQSYILDAAWNQVMIASVTSPSSNVYLEIYGQQDGVYQTRFSNNATSWKGWLPWTQSYIVKVFNSGGSSSDYTLDVEIPARIQFAYGSYSGSVYGYGSAAKIISYVLYARNGQTMTATISSSSSSVYLSIDGFSGNQSLVASSAGKTTWTGTLPQTQEYIVRAVQNTSTWVDFTLTVTIV